MRQSPPPEGGFPCDLHVLGLPPAFVLSQDQTLRLNLKPPPAETRESLTSNGLLNRTWRSLSNPRPPKPRTTRQSKPPSHPGQENKGLRPMGLVQAFPAPRRSRKNHPKSQERDRQSRPHKSTLNHQGKEQPRNRRPRIPSNVTNNVKKRVATNGLRPPARGEVRKTDL